MNEYEGNYKINDKNQLICNVTTLVHTDVSSNVNESFKLTFKIIDLKKLQLENISDKNLYHDKSIGKIFEK